MFRFFIPGRLFFGRELPQKLVLRGVIVAVASTSLMTMSATAQVGSLRAGAMSGPGKKSGSSAAATSQTATAATGNTSQTIATSSVAQQAQVSLTHSLQALQALQSAQGAARTAALNSANNLGLDPISNQTLPDVTDGLGGTGLVPLGGVPNPLSGSSIQIIQLGANGKGSLNLANGGAITLPKGTPGNDTVSVAGAGTITSTGGSVTASAGSITTSGGGTISTASAGGSISLTGSSTLTIASATSFTSSLPATITLPNGGGQVALAANTATPVPIPAGSKVTFTGTAAGTVDITGAGTVTLGGAGTLTLAGTPASGAGGSITTNIRAVSFTNGVSTSLPAGSTIQLNGASTVNFAGGTGGNVPVIIPSSTTNYTTSGTLLSTTGYNLPPSWVLGPKTNPGALSQSIDPTTGHIIDTITQEQQQALLYWSSFNIGKNTTLSFDQSAGGASVSQWVAINEITDPSLHPSQILGAIEAPGQVYVINQNGIIFGGSSQVNVGALTASSLALNPDYINNGLLNDAGNNFEFQFSSLFTTTTAKTGPRGHQVLTTTVAPLWTAPPTVPAGGSQTVSSVATGDITVQAGAQLSSPTNSNHQGGRIALVAPNVTNDGTISTPDGQTILAAGLQVGFSAHNADDASLRGLDVYVGRVQADATTLPSGPFTLSGLPNGDPLVNGQLTSGSLTFAGSGTVGTYTTPDGTVNNIMGGAPVTIPSGSTVSLTGNGPSYAAVAKVGVVTNAGNTLDSSGNILTPGGDIEAPRADVTLTGATVNQFGIINSSTSVTLNGRIDLLADYNSAAETVSGVSTFAPSATGTVTMGGQSVTQILPETSSTETTIGTQLALASLVDVQGAEIDMLSGSLLYAPSASGLSGSALDLAGASLTSGVTFNAGSWFVNGNPGAETVTFSNDSGAINLGAGATIDVSGSQDVSASVADNIIPVQLRGPELANSPLQRNGQLRGTTVYIDIRDAGVYDGQAWIGTPIGDVSGYVNDVQRTVGELTTDGGTVALNAGSSVATGAGASINVSGGWINYAGANVQTTQVLRQGQLIDISQATPNLAYSGIYTGLTTTSAKWGVSQTFINSLLDGSQYEAGYTQGGNGGKISISAPSMNLSGNFYGTTLAGAYQRTSQSSLSSTYAGASFLPTTLKISGVPNASELDLLFDQNSVDGAGKVYSTAPNVTFQTDAFISQNTPAPDELLLSQDIVNDDGFGKLTIDASAGGNGGGTITVPQGVALTTSSGGLISFTGSNIDVEGSIAVPGGGAQGGISLTALEFSPAQTFSGTAPSADPARGNITLGSGASLSSSGLVVDDQSTASAPDTLPFLTAGGNISIAALDVDLAPGSKIDVSGGVAISTTGKAAFGNAGSISILAGKDPVQTSIVSGGELILGSTMTGYSGNVGGGGSLTIQSPLVQIGGGAMLQNGDSSAAPFTAGEAGVTYNGTTLWINSANGPAGDFFSQGGFGSFDLEGLGQIRTATTNGTTSFVFNAAGDPVVDPAVLIADNTVIDPVVQSYAATFNGSGVTLAPVPSAQASALLPSQRSAVNLTFNAEGVSSGFSSDLPPTNNGVPYSNAGNTGGGLQVRGDLVVGSGAKIITDPQTNSSHGISLLAAKGTIEVLGSVIAPGGTIKLIGGDTTQFSNNQLLYYESSASQPFATIDLGPNSLLSAAGTTELTVNNLGLRTGSVLPGGQITVNGNLVAESGAVLDVSGASAVLSEPAAALGVTSASLITSPYAPTHVASNGGAITLNATQLLYSDATLLGGAGGPSAQGGSLTITSGTSATFNQNSLPTTSLDAVLVVSQQGLDTGGFSLPSGIGTGEALLGQTIPGSSTELGATINDAVGGQPVYSYFAANTDLFSSKASNTSLSNNGGMAGGFASLNLPGTVDFSGAVSITTARSISVAKSSGTDLGGNGGLIYADSSVVLTAPYVALNVDQTSSLPDSIVSYPAATAGPGSLTVNATTLADVGNISLQNIGTVSFNTGSGAVGDIRGDGTLQVAGQINLDAAQIYPPTEDTFTIEGTDVSISRPAGQGLPALPLSGGGTLDILADTIEQNGVLRAPFGVINLGSSSTQSITLGAGSITSVSGVDPTTGKGIMVPYGIVNADGIWYDPLGNDISLTGPPAKAVNIAGQDVKIQTGSTIDVTGGGELFGYSFTSGTGGNQDILVSTGNALSSNSFAIVPTLGAAYAPIGTYALSSNLVTNGSADAGYFNSNLSVGEQVYLNASNGLPAGTYTLLPARYALLPGAFLITPTGSAVGASVMQPDGSSLVSGYATSGFDPTTSPVFTGYSIYSQASVLQRAPYTINLASAYFPVSAANNNLTTPRLPGDSGQLVLDASQSLSIQGTLLSQAAQGGLGGEVDIASPEDIYIVGPSTQNVPTGALVLDSSQLTNFGAASLLIGGYRTNTDEGTVVTATTSNLVVDNSGAMTTVGGVTVAGLAAPDITLVSNADLTVAPGAAIEQVGQLSGSAPTLILQGNGSLLRVSSDSSAQILRQNVVAGDTTSVLSIGAGATILDANGSAAGALILDSTGSVKIDPSTTAPPVLMGKSVTLDSSLINLELGTPATAPTSGLVITAPQLASLLSSTQSLSLLSYSSIAIYGSGQIGSVTVGADGKKTYQEANLALHADDVYYADTQNSSGVTINAQTVSLDNLSGGTVLPSLGGLGTSSLTVNAQTITLGSNALRIDQFGNVALNADGAILLRGLGTVAAGSDTTPVAASLGVGGNLTLTTPLITSATSTDQPISSTTTSLIDMAINATGSLLIQAPTTDTATPPSAGNLAASLALSAANITQDSGSSIVLHSGSLALQANGTAGSSGGADIIIGGTLDVSGTKQAYYSVEKYTNGGQITLASLNGNVTMGTTGLANVSAASGVGTADSGAGNGGTLSVTAGGLFTPGQIEGQGSVVTQGGTTLAQGSGGTFSLDAGSLDPSGSGNATLSTLESALAGFTSQTVRDRNDSTVTVDGTVMANSFDLSADKGSIVVAGTIDASNTATGGTGGSISLEAGGSVTTQSGSLLTVAGNQLNSAGQGGSVTLEAGTYEGTAVSTSTAAINLAGTIDLSVAGATGGTLLLRAPQVSGGTYSAGSSYAPVEVNAAGGGAPTDVAIAPIVVGSGAGSVENASSIVVEGFYAQDAQTANAQIDAYEGNAEANASAFMSQMSSIETRIFGSSAANVHIRPGEEIDNSQGSLELASTWDLSTLRYGAPLLDGQGNPVTNAAGNTVLSEPGVLTIRAAGNINLDFDASLTDGFDGSAGVSYLNALMPVGSQSWAYQITSGADFSAANPGMVQTAAQLQSSGLGGSLQVGVQNSTSPTILSEFSQNDPAVFFETIRTGSGNITINSGGDVLLLDNLATIYTAGSQVDGTLGGAFVPPAGTDENGDAIPATYSSGGGNVLISAQGNIAHETYSPDGSTLVADSSDEMPTNWLDREGAVSDGQVVTATTWWVDFTNFFEGVGALGGGNVTLNAGGSVVNVDAVVPTNAREVNGTLTELGGGNLTVRAGNNIDAGVYYVENGQGTLQAGGNILTNATRAASLQSQPSTSIDWLPTTLFLGNGSFSVSAQGNLLLGPVANPFLLPQSYNNQDLTSAVPTSETSYFSTYAATDAVDASALGGTLTIKDFTNSGEGSLYNWYIDVLNAPVSGGLGDEASASQPWLRLATAALPQQVVAEFGPSSDLSVGSPANVFGGLTALLPPTLRATAFSGDIDLYGSLTLSPSNVGTVALMAEGSVNAFGVNDVLAITQTATFGSGLINLSDANPSALPSALAPISSGTLLADLDNLFTETGATEGITLQTKQDLHALIDDGSLHANDPNPAYIYAATGDISGLTFFSAKQAQVIAGQDITDIGLYIQNNNADDISLVQAGRDIIAYDSSSPLRVAAGTAVSGYDPLQSPAGTGAGAPNSGDIQISGPGTLEVLAGRNLTLGEDSGLNPNKPVDGDGVFAGLTSVGGESNPSLPLAGANIIALAGLGTGLPAGGLDQSSLTFSTFITQFLDPSSSFASTYLPDLASALGLSNVTDSQIWNIFSGAADASLTAGESKLQASLTPALRDTYALDIFYLVLRDAGRNHNNSGNPGFGNYDAGDQAIKALFPTSATFQGNIDITSREIKTASGGDIDLLTPGGGVTVGVNDNAGQAVDQGILTVNGGNISIFANGDVSVGTSRIFTLHGGNEIIYSSVGSIDAGASSKTVVSAPPTRVVVDPTSGSVQTDLAGLSTGGGIGVLASVVGAPPGDVDLIAPLGTINAGDAGIRASGNLNIAALKVLNADNISVGGKSTGVPAGASVNVAAVTAASAAAGSATAAAQNAGPNKQDVADASGDIPSIITVDVIGYGGGDQD
jgi:filamentous hemagglutinin